MGCSVDVPSESFCSASVCLSKREIILLLKLISLKTDRVKIVGNNVNRLFLLERNLIEGNRVLVRIRKSLRTSISDSIVTIIID